MPVQWVDFAKGVVVGRDYPDDPKLREAGPPAGLALPGAVPRILGFQTANVTDLVKKGLPISISIAFMAFFLWIAGGVLFGVAAALIKGPVVDRGWSACPWSSTRSRRSS